MRECPYCAEEIEDDPVFCRFCGSELVRSAEAARSGSPVPAGGLPSPPETRGAPIRADQAAPLVNASAPAHATVGERQAIGILKALAWVVLALGTLGGIVVMAQSSQASYDAFGYGSGGSSGLLVAAGLGMIIYSVIGWAFLLVLASMATNLMLIRENTRK